jgi:acetyl esterase/lipase
VLAAWRELPTRGADPVRTGLAGDSAGGWLALTAALRLRDAGEPLPAVLGLVSPWLDLRGASWPPGRIDPMLRPDWLRRCAADFAPGADLGSPALAPLTAELAGLPPMVVHVGSEEILLEDSVALAKQARAAGVPVELRRFDGLWHVAHASAGLVAGSTAAVTALGTALAARMTGRSATG